MGSGGSESKTGLGPHELGRSIRQGDPAAQRSRSCPESRRAAV